MKRFLALLFFSATLAFPQASGVGQIWTVVSGTLQSGAIANGFGTTLSVAGLSSATWTVNCSVPCSGGTTINFEGSQDASTFVALPATQLLANTIITSTVVNQGATATVWQTPIGGLQSIRARISGYNAGTITVTATATAAPFPGQAINLVDIVGSAPATSGTGILKVGVVGATGGTIDGAPSATAPGQALQAGAAFNTTPATLTSGQMGALQVDAAENLLVNLKTAIPTGANVIGALSANQSTNEAQINGVTPLMGNGVTGTGSQRVTIASDNTAFAVNSTLSAETTKVVGTARVQGNLGAAFDAATGAAPPANGILMAGITSGATGGFLTGVPVCDSFANINIVTATTTLLVTGVSGRHVRICHIDMVAAAADNVGIISGTGATCGTGSAAIVGTTSATGYNFAANGGIAQGSGLGTIMRTVATGDSVCLITSAATQLSGVISYTIY